MFFCPVSSPTAMDPEEVLRARQPKSTGLQCLCLLLECYGDGSPTGPSPKLGRPWYLYQLASADIIPLVNKGFSFFGEHPRITQRPKW